MTTDQPHETGERSPVESPPIEDSPSRDLIRIAREEDAQIQRSIVRFIVGVTLGFLVSICVMSVGVTLDQMWLFYAGMGMAVLCMGMVLLRL